MIYIVLIVSISIGVLFLVLFNRLVLRDKSKVVEKHDLKEKVDKNALNEVIF